MTGPLDGLLVADFSRVLAGPYATMLLADMGAEVVKVEGPPTGDETRSWTPPERDGVSTYYLGINRGKRSIVLDLREEADVALARELARRADVFIENLKPGGMAKFGLDFESVRSDNPGIVYASISGFGSGDGAHVPGYDLLVQAMSGLMSLTGSADGPGYRAGISVFDVMAGNHAVIGILAALRHRDRDRARASTSRSTCSPRRSPGWSTTAPRGWPAARCPTGWATPTRASSPTSRSPPPTPT